MLHAVLKLFTRKLASKRARCQVLSRTIFNMSLSNERQRMVWVDLEMTGLDVDKDRIIEVASLITDGDLNIVAEGSDMVIHQPDELLDGMNDWCKEHHGKSGLTEAVRKSTISTRQAEQDLLSFVKKHCPPNCCPLVGNSIHVDKKFLDKYMPEFCSYLHYRIVDVSTIKELFTRWYPSLSSPKKSNAHRAMEDIKESIEELKFYKEHVFKSEAEVRLSPKRKAAGST